MHSSIIGKIDKARKYAEEKDRVSITSLKATFQGNHNTYELEFASGSWHCECRSFPHQRHMQLHHGAPTDVGRNAGQRPGPRPDNLAWGFSSGSCPDQRQDTQHGQ